MPKGDTDWELLLQEAEKICKNSSNPLLRGLLHEVIKDIERRHRTNEGQNTGL